MKEGVKARPLGGKRPPKKKVCPFCVNKVDEIDYIALAKEMEKSSERSFKDGEKRTRYITEKGKILPRRMSGVCVKHQRALSQAIKRARFMALLPYKAD
ncbi:MAG: 30S ribosomal protein S18 [Firmicutes bacterium]|uniref:Small ribosomal subunit protein bS18 n=1 Tax=Candidatus Stercoripulliclostridium pullicola TaxID=2840953 RepID=A0A940DI92_9FIRM|nr:30S ribosomal protein S18 [Candidatus Stercoripulliclostridium pullicola]